MVASIEVARVNMWGNPLGAVAWMPGSSHAVFEYDPGFIRSGLDPSPVHMPIEDAINGQKVFEFRSLSRETFKGLPGLLADALPDKFGNAIIDAWLARQGRPASSFSPIERLCYTGNRGMGALEFEPVIGSHADDSVPVEVAELVALAQEVTQERLDLEVSLNHQGDDAVALMDIIRVGTSAGGARPKAVIAMDGQGNVRSGQVPAPAGYDYWLLKFDGVDDLELGKSRGYGRIEYAYYQMASAAGIEMTECRLLEEGGRSHFLTKRFDRVGGQKIHMQSLCGIAHADFNLPGAYSYEEAFGVMRQLHLTKAEAAQQYRRMIFNVMTRNQDDHTKNIAFMMDASGEWRLSPAFDVTYAHNPAGKWTSQHQMSLNGKRDNFTLADLVAVGESISLSKPREVVSEIGEVVSHWPEFAKEAGIDQETVRQISGQFRRF